MKNVERIKSEGKIIAIIARGVPEDEGIHFLTPPAFSQQLGLMYRKKDYIIQPHVHKTIRRMISVIQEVLYILSGSIEITLYNKHREKVKSLVLKGGDTVMLVSGGHGIKFLEDSRLLEVKQGPYSGVGGDKEHF